MKLVNYQDIAKKLKRKDRSNDYRNVRVHKRNDISEEVKVSVILLDWECRERFHTVDWLSRQDVPRNEYELIWVELYERVVPEVFEKVDVYITCGQKGLYHKHVGYNLGLLNSKGEIITVCDSDAVYPPDFISSILKSFYKDSNPLPIPLVLMHHQLRTSSFYPHDLQSTEVLDDAERWKWWPIVPNAGACMSVRKEDAISFGGFDEHKYFRGYLCGPYDLGWRLVNFGIPEHWYESTVIWHFAHPDPVGSNEITPWVSMLLEHSNPHVDLHALRAVEAFSTGQYLPLKENPEIFLLRMSKRIVGTDFEKKYSDMTGQSVFPRWLVMRMRLLLFLDIARDIVWILSFNLIQRAVKGAIGKRGYDFIHRVSYYIYPRGHAELVESYYEYNIIKFGHYFYAAPKSLGHIDFGVRRQRNNPKILRSKRYEELKQSIERSPTTPRYLDSYDGRNIIKYKNNCYIIPQSLGSVDFNNKEQINNPSILVVSCPNWKRFDDKKQNALFDIAGSLCSNGNYTKGLAVFDEAIRLDPLNNPCAFCGRGWAHYQKGSFKEAVKDFNKGLDNVDEDDINVVRRIFRDRNWACYKIAQLDKAIKDFNGNRNFRNLFIGRNLLRLEILKSHMMCKLRKGWL